jgi:hypothetical protein
MTKATHEQESTSSSLEQEGLEHDERPRRPRRASELKFAKPKMSYAETEERLAKAIGTQDQDFLHNLIHQIVAAGELGKPSDDLEVNFLLSVIEGILSDQSNSAAKAIVATQFAAVHVQIVKLARNLNRTSDPQLVDILGRLFNSLARTSVAQYQALTHSHAGVTVGHVSVNQGGQAIVGSVTHNQEEPAATQKAEPPQPLLADAKAVPMPIIEECEEQIPVPVSRKESKR